MNLNDLQELITQNLGSNRKILNLVISKLPAKGVTSVMFKIEVKMQDKNDKEELLHLVVKTVKVAEIRENFASMRDIFQRESKFYEIVLPLLKNFQIEEGVSDVMDNFAEFYGARYDIDGGDEDLMLLMEDLLAKGFDNIDKTVGFDLNHAEYILRDLARFHGTAIAFKLKRPDIFQNKIRRLCSSFDFSKAGSFTTDILNCADKLVTFYPEYNHLIKEAIKFLGKNIRSYREPFGTIIHFDPWVNNIMNKTEKDGKVKTIFVDFQIYDYGSPASDVFYFLWTSINVNVLQQYLDHLMKHYHQSLLNTLKDFRIDTRMFEYKNFEEEIKYKAKDYEFGHALFFKCFILFLKPEGLKIEDSPELGEFVHFMVTECKKRGWVP